jgi:uncharacterized FAD-dependent dehydrogenase
VTDLDIEKGQVRGVRWPGGRDSSPPTTSCWRWATARATPSDAARARCVHGAKPFSVGFRIEHPQSLIDRARFGVCRPPAARRGRLQAGASRQQRSRGLQLLHVPGRHGGGGHVGTGRVVTNGMSQYSRNERNANAGIVVGISPEDFPAAASAGRHRFQRALESRAFELGGGTYERRPTGR